MKVFNLLMFFRKGRKFSSRRMKLLNSNRKTKKNNKKKTKKSRNKSIFCFQLFYSVILFRRFHFRSHPFILGL